MPTEQITMYFHAASERTLGPPVPDEEHRDDRRGLDGHPEHADVRRQHGEQHDGHERLDQHAVER